MSYGLIGHKNVLGEIARINLNPESYDKLENAPRDAKTFTVDKPAGIEYFVAFVIFNKLVPMTFNGESAHHGFETSYNQGVLPQGWFFGERAGIHLKVENDKIRFFLKIPKKQLGFEEYRDVTIIIAGVL